MWIRVLVICDDTHNLCVFCLGKEHARDVLEGKICVQLAQAFAGRRHMIGKVVTGCVAILSYHTATQDRGSECRDFGFISRIVTALTNIYIHSLATLLGTPCYYRVGPHFAFKTALILRGIDSTRCWKHSSYNLDNIDMIASHSCCRFGGCTSMMRISRSTTSQRCSIGLKSGDCGGHLSKVNSLSCSRNQSEMIWALWHGALFIAPLHIALW